MSGTSPASESNVTIHSKPPKASVWLRDTVTTEMVSRFSSSALTATASASTGIATVSSPRKDSVNEPDSSFVPARSRSTDTSWGSVAV